jgi:hypothetical protein
MRIIIILAAYLLAGCKAPLVAPKDICDFPRNFAGWRGTNVSFKGVLVGTFEHGYVLVAEGCERRGIRFAKWPEGSDGIALNKVLNRWDTGLARAEFTGKLSREGLLVTHTKNVTYETMSTQEKAAFFRSRGF